MFSFLKKAFPFGLAVVFAVVLAGCSTGQETVTRLTAEAEKGDVESMVKVAEMYCSGTNIEQDDQICGMWMKRAAEKGHTRAQYIVGRMYELGLGMRADPVQAYKWYSLSAAQNYHMADTGAKNMWTVMSPQQQAEAKKLVAESGK